MCLLQVHSWELIGPVKKEKTYDSYRMFTRAEAL